MVENENIVTYDVVRKALQGASIRNDPELLLGQYDGIVPPELSANALIVQNNYEDFQKLVWKRLEELPLTKRYFGRLIRGRLKQSAVLASPIISTIFDDYQTLEQRLENIQIIDGVDSLRNEYGSNSNESEGSISDDSMKNMLAEILVLDFLMKLEFINIRKIARKDKTHIDIAAEKDGKNYAIDSTRKQEIDWEIDDSTNLEDCTNSSNLLKIRKLIQNALKKKDKQFSDAIAEKTIENSAIKIIALKTSDYGFSNCIEQAAIIAKELLGNQNQWLNIDGIWLIPNIDVKDSVWVTRA